jgi:hypothetical protein
VVVKIDLSIAQIAVSVLETGTENVVVVNANIFGGKVERHSEVGEIWREAVEDI